MRSLILPLCKCLVFMPVMCKILTQLATFCDAETHSYGKCSIMWPTCCSENLHNKKTLRLLFSLDPLDVPVNSPCGQRCAPHVRAAVSPWTFSLLITLLRGQCPSCCCCLASLPFHPCLWLCRIRYFSGCSVPFVCQFVWVAAYVCVRTGVEKASLLCRRLPGFQVCIGFVSFGR